MKLFLLLIPFMCFTDIPKKGAAKKQAVKKVAKAATYQYPSIFIFSIN
jgi:hypothetical protein